MRRVEHDSGGFWWCGNNSVLLELVTRVKPKAPSSPPVTTINVDGERYREHMALMLL